MHRTSLGLAIGGLSSWFLVAATWLSGCGAAERSSPQGLAEAGCAGCTVLKGGTVFDGARAARATVVIEGDRVTQVVLDERDVEIVGGEVVDVAGKTVLPGLIDLHVHSLSAAGPYAYHDGDLHLEDHTKAMLRSGVTSYLDLGSLQHVIFEQRARVRAGEVLAPQLFAAGPLLTATGGHPCVHGSPPGDFCLFIDAPADVAEAFEALLPGAPDVIKIVLESGGSRPLPRLSPDSVAAIAQAAGAAGVRVIAHATSAADIEVALDAGVTRFAHIPDQDRISPELARRMAAAGAVVVPTLALTDGLYRAAHGTLTELDDPALGDDVPADVIAALRDPSLIAELRTARYKELVAAWRARGVENLMTCYRAGVTIAAGSDAGNPAVFHGLALRREVALLVEAGMPPIDALAAATRAAADVLGRPDLGRIEAGALADVLVVDGDPLADARALERVARVYKSGILLDRDALALPRGTSLSRQPRTGAGRGDTCLGAPECGDALSCSADQRCAATCDRPSACAPGSACVVDGGSPTGGSCVDGDGCDLFAQDCENGAACVFLGNGATSCWYAGAGSGGQPCDALFACAPGSQCDEASSTCKDLCDPRGARARACPGGKKCVDRSAIAGLPVGVCD
ncbi:amidohydrolase family protein [Sorangium cellulosum]|uniref:amidohydrolase family protein n=1 Tax=Sorangium cellulosum TaxID=56 RepID=UPI0007C5D949|nr:amidohydrolase family protein [Sorangium cellulosum]